MKNFTVHSILPILLFGVINLAQAGIFSPFSIADGVQFDSTNYETLNLIEDTSQDFILDNMFSSDTGDSLFYAITQLAANGIIEAKIEADGSGQPALKLTGIADRFGQASLTITATSNVDNTISLAQSITVIVTPVDDPPTLVSSGINSIESDQFPSDTTLTVDLSNVFTDVEGDEITLSHSIVNLMEGTDISFTSITSADLADNLLQVGLSANNKYAVEVTVNATSNDTLTTSTTFEIIVDNAPSQNGALASLEEGFADTTFHVSAIYQDDDTDGTGFELSYSDFLPDSLFTVDVIESDTNKLVHVAYNTATGDITLSGKTNDFGTFALIVEVTQGLRTIKDTLEITVTNTDDAAVVKNSIQDQFLPIGNDITFYMKELYTDIDSDLDFSKMSLTTDNETDFQIRKIVDGSFQNQSGPTVSLGADSVINILATGGEGAVGTFTFSYDISADFPGSDPIEDVFTLEISRPVATFYVDPSGSDSNDGSQGNPYLTIQKAINSALDKDTIFVSPGLYQENIFINKAVVLVSSQYNGSKLSSEMVRNTAIQGAENGGSVITIVDVEGVKLIGLDIKGHSNGNTSTSSFRNWTWLNGTNTFVAGDSLDWETGHLTNLQNDVNYYALLKPDAQGKIESRPFFEWNFFYFEVDSGTAGGFSGEASLLFTFEGRDIYSTNFSTDFYGAKDYIQGQVPTGRLLNIDSRALYDSLIAHASGPWGMIGLTNRETVNSIGAGIFSRHGSFHLINCIVEDNKVSKTNWDTGAGVLVRNAKYVNIIDSEILNNETQGGETSGIHIMNSDDVSIQNTLINGNTVVSDNNCVTAGLQVRDGKTLNLVNSIIIGNDFNCNEVRINRVDNYVINHTIIENGLTLNDLEFKSGKILNSIFLKGSISNWGPTNTNYLEISHNLINAGVNLDYPLSKYGQNNIMGGTPGFNDPESGDYSLSDVSTLIGAGVPTEAATDLYGNERPAPEASNPDIGPIENLLDGPDLVFRPYAYFNADSTASIPLRYQTSSWNREMNALEVADFDNDGFSEIVFYENVDSRDLVLADNQGNRSVLLQDWASINVIKGMDLDNDNDLDLILGTNGSIAYLENLGPGNWAAEPTVYESQWIGEHQGATMVWGDVTQDGRVDGVVGDYSGVTIYEFTEAGPQVTNLNLNNANNEWLGDFGQAFVADINGDTQLDLILERRWFNQDVKDLVVFIRDRSSFVYSEELSIIGVLPPPDQYDQNHDLFVLTGDIDQDASLDLLVSYNPQNNSKKGYLKRFELTSGTAWQEQVINIAVNDSVQTDINEIYQSFISPRLMALDGTDHRDIVLFTSDESVEWNENDRYFNAVMLHPDGDNFVLKNGYFTQERFQMSPWDSKTLPNIDFGHLDDDGAFDLVLSGTKDNGQNNLMAFENTFDITPPASVPAPTDLGVAVSGSKVEISFGLQTPFYNIELCVDGTCNKLYATNNGSLLDYPVLYEVDSTGKVLTFLLGSGTYQIAVQGIDQGYHLSDQVTSDAFTVEGLEFTSANEIFKDFFNDVHLINIDNDLDPEVYGFKRRFWYNGGERPSTLTIFNLDSASNSNKFILDNTGETPLLSDFDLNGKADILVDEGSCNWPQKPYAYLENIDETTSVDVFSESFTDLNIAIDGGNCDPGITNRNLAIDIDQDGKDEVLTAISSNWDDRGISVFALEPEDFSKSVILTPNTSDGGNWNGEELDQIGPLFNSRLEQGGYGNYIGMVHSYFDPDNDGDADHILAVNMYLDAKPITALYFLENLGAGRIAPHYLNHFIDKNIIHINVVYDGEDETRILISISDDTNYWQDAYSARFVKFQMMTVSNNSNVFNDILDRNRANTSGQSISMVNFKTNDLGFVNYAPFHFDGIGHANLLETGDMNNDGLNDMVVVGTNSEDTWNANAQLNIYLQNELGGFDPFISQISSEVKQLSFISSLNLVDLNSDAQFDVIVSGRKRGSNDGVTLSFINQTSASSAVSLSTPTGLAGQNNGYKMELTWDDANAGVISYAVQIGTELNSYNISLGKLNQYGNPLFPDRFESFHPDQSLVFDAYDLADNYYFRVKAIDQYGNTSSFSDVGQVSLSQPFAEMSQTIPGVEEGGVAWGDYDRDGDLDLAIMGKQNGFVTSIYRNDNGVFTNTNQNLSKQVKGDIEWVDYDNDGFLDLVVVGLDTELNPSFSLYHNENGLSFAKVEGLDIPGLTDATIAFGDADADGDMDMALAGLGEVDGNVQYLFKMFTNRYNEENSLIFERSPNFEYEGFINGDIVFADFDNDGDLDIVYSGTGKGDVAVGGIIVNSRVGLKLGSYFYYQNEIALKDASISVGDIDLDGDLDMIATGIREINQQEVPVCRFYYNEYYKIDSVRSYLNFRFEDSKDIVALSNGDADLADFDNDGDLDILISGADSLGNPRTALYAQRSGDFFLVNTGFEDVMQSTVKWADFDTDGDIDVFLSGKTGVLSTTKVYENNTGSLINSSPAAPSGLIVTDYGFGRIKLSWDKPADDYTPSNTLSYVIALGRTSGESDIFTTESNLETGYRLSPKPSSALQNFLYLEMDPGKYYFSVQAVDANYSGSLFSAESSFEVKYSWKELNLGGLVDNTLPSGENASIKFADFDGDGDFDLGIFGKNENEQYRLGLLENKSGAFEKIYDFDPITKGDFDWADVNGDGTLDLFITGEDPFDETNVRASLWLNRTPVANKTDSTYDGTWRWADGRPFEESFLNWQMDEPNDDQSYMAYAVLNGNNQVEMWDIGSNMCCVNSAFVEVPKDPASQADGIWRWADGRTFQDELQVDENQSGDMNKSSEVFAVLTPGMTVYASSVDDYRTLPAIVEVPEGTEVNQSDIDHLGTFNGHDYYLYFGSYTATEMWDIVDTQFPEFSHLLVINSNDEVTWIQENAFVNFQGDVWIGVRAEFPHLEVENQDTWFIGTYANHHYFGINAYDASNVNQVLAVIDELPVGTHLFVPDSLEEWEFFMENQPYPYGLIGLMRKGFAPSSEGGSAANFQNTGIQFTPLVNSKVKFVDIDNDGMPELVYAGSTSSTSVGKPDLKIYKFQTNGFDVTATEVQLATALPKFTESSIEFGDLDNDKDVDIVIAGFDPISGRQTVIYLNEGIDPETGQFILTPDVSNNLVGVQNGTLDLIDFDNDGDLDLVVTGDSQTGDILEIFDNRDGSFVALSAVVSGLEAMKNGKTSWGDFNGDGYADMLYSGEVTGVGNFTGLAIYDNNSGSFVPDDFDLSEFVNAAVAFGDFDGDNDLDMVLTGTNRNFIESDPGSTRYISKLYVNVRNESAQVPGIAPQLPGVNGTTAPLAASFTTNQPPTIPSIVGNSILENEQGTDPDHKIVDFSWTPSIDDNTTSEGLTYALRVGTTPGGNDIMDARANADGSRKVSGVGNVEHNTSWKLELPTGKYYWSVQALDPSYAASAFSEEQLINVTATGLQTNVAPVLADQQLSIRDVVSNGYVVGDLEATDENGDAVSYKITNGDNSSVFGISYTTGKLVVADASQLDADVTSSYQLTIEASDGALTDQATFTINVEKNFLPQVGDYQFEIAQGLQNGALVGIIEATDQNQDPITFSIVNGNTNGAFEVDESGQLLVKASETITSGSSFTLNVEVNDGYETVMSQVSISVNGSVLGANGGGLSVNIYPNPTRDILHISNESGSQLKVTLIDITGSKILETGLDTSDLIINLQNRDAGMYILTIRDENAKLVKTLRVVKMD